MKLLTLILCLSSISAFAAFPVVSGRNPAQRADTVYEMITKELVYTAKTPEKFKSIRAATNDLRNLLKADDVTPEMREHIEKYIAALESLPEKKGFRKNECADYEVEDKAKPLLDSLCQ